MPTFYPNGFTAPYTPPTWKGGWDQTSGATTAMFDSNKIGQIATATVAQTSSALGWKVAVSRFVSRTLAPQTFSGTFDFILGLSENNAGANFYTKIYIYVTQGNTDAVRGVLLDYTESAAGGATEWPTTAAGVALQAAQTLASIGALEGDHVVIEFGYSSENVSGINRSGSCRRGNRTTSETALGDLTVGSTSVTTLTGSFNFSGGIVLSTTEFTNLTWETSEDLGTAIEFSGSGIANVNDATYDRWYKWTPAVSSVVGIWFFSDVAVGTYRPSVQMYTVSGSVVSIGNMLEAVNVPFQLPTVAATSYYFKVATNGNFNPAAFTYDFLGAPTSQISVGSILINDDSTGLPGAIISPTTGEIINFVRDMAAGETGDILRASGVMALYDFGSSSIIVYDVDFDIIATIAGHSVEPEIRANIGQNRFYIAKDNGATHTISMILPDGTVSGTTYTMTITNIKPFAVTNDGLYALHSDGITTGQAIKKWDLINATALADFAPGIVGYRSNDILILSDNTVLISFFKNATNEFVIRYYDSLGNQLNEYNIGLSTRASSIAPRLSYGLDDASFYVFWHPDFSTNRIQQINTTTGAVLSTLDNPEFEFATWAGTETATPPRFGSSNSCPFMVLGQVGAITTSNGDGTLIISAVIINAASGIYKLVPLKRNDTLWTEDFESTQDVKIPRPYAKTSYIG